jgi:hypothetical protein
MNSHQPQAQGHVVQSALHAHDILRRRKKNAFNSRSKIRQLYPTASGNYEFKIFEGDTLYSEKNGGRTHQQYNREGSGTQDGFQHPKVLSALNQFQVSEDEWIRIPGFTDHEKLRNAVFSKVTIQGVSLKTHEWEGLDKHPIDEPVILRYGTKGIPNYGPNVFKPMDWIMLDVPDPTLPMNRVDPNGNTANMRKFVTVPLQEMDLLNMDTLLTFLYQCGFTPKKKEEYGEMERITEDMIKLVKNIVSSPHCYQRDCFLGLSAIMGHLADKHYENESGEEDKKLCQTINMKPSEVYSIIVFGMSLVTEDKLRSLVEKHLNLFKRQSMEIRERCIGRSLRGAKPGEHMDALIGVF